MSTDREDTSVEGTSTVERVSALDRGVLLGVGDDDGPARLADPGRDYWLSDGRTDEERLDFIESGIHGAYQSIVNELYDSADAHVERFNSLGQRHVTWRSAVIVTTGVLAILNAVAAYFSGHPLDPGQGSVVAGVLVSLPLGAAILAAILAIMTNLENFSNYLDRSEAHREARELFLDGAREAERLWQTHVVAFGARPEACLNARELYRRLCIKDTALRTRAKDLTKWKASRGPA